MASSEEDQMKAALSESRMEIDPVSGNDVPPGALPQEVRDDVDAKLSEGEYVVPADVLRYYGVKFFEDLRNKAKKSLQAMDEDGRIGGAPLEEEMDDLPFSDEELVSEDDTEGEVMEASRGALVGYQEGGMQLSYPSYIKQPNLASVGMPSPSGTASTGGVEYRKYVNDAGMSITIPYYNGQPMGIVPVGYYTESSAPKQGTQDTANIVTEEKGGKSEPEADWQRPDYASMSAEDLNKQLDQLEATKKVATGLMATGVAAPVGIAMLGANKLETRAINKVMEAKGYSRTEATEDPKKPGLMSKIADFITGADKEVSMSEVVGKDDSGKDTYGAVKGFDSGMGAVAAPPERPDRTTGQDKNDEEKAGGLVNPIG
jgi:Arc/MetJ-type ribon-helix-helix transcriptional regulator